MTAMISRATNGNDTKTVARTMPGTAKMILMSCSNSHGPNQPCRPNSCTKISPETTGDTANGRSMSVISRRLPRNSNLVIAHAAAMPNTSVGRHRRAPRRAASARSPPAPRRLRWPLRRRRRQPLRNASAKTKAKRTKRREQEGERNRRQRDATMTVRSATARGSREMLAPGQPLLIRQYATPRRAPALEAR